MGAGVTFDPNAPSTEYAAPPAAKTPATQAPAQAPSFDPNAPSEEYTAPAPTTPPLSAWPGIVGRSFLKATAPLGYGDFVQMQQAEGKPAPSPSEYMAMYPPEQRYGGTLGYLQQGASTLGSPVGGPLSAIFPGATIAGDIAHEWARQHGWSETAQDALSLGAGGAGGALVDKAAGWVGGKLADLAESRIASGASDVSRTLAAKAGVADPVAAGTSMKHEVGNVIQNEVGDAVSATGPVAATARAMKARAAKPGIKLPTADPGTDYLTEIDQATTPSAAVDRAMQNPEYFRSLPPNARLALGSWYAAHAAENPEAWLNTDPAVRKLMIPDVEHRIAVSATAQQALDRAATQAQASPAAKPNMLQQAASAALHHLGKPGAGGVIGHFLGPALGLGAPWGEALGVGAALAKPIAKYAITPRGAGNILTGADQGYLGSP